MSHCLAEITRTFQGSQNCSILPFPLSCIQDNKTLRTNLFSSCVTVACRRHWLQDVCISRDIWSEEKQLERWEGPGPVLESSQAETTRARPLRADDFIYPCSQIWPPFNLEKRGASDFWLGVQCPHSLHWTWCHAATPHWKDLLRKYQPSELFPCLSSAPPDGLSVSRRALTAGIATLPN